MGQQDVRTSLTVIHKSRILTEPGWKSDMEKQIFLSGCNRPEGVNIYGYKSVCMLLFDETTALCRSPARLVGRTMPKKTACCHC